MPKECKQRTYEKIQSYLTEYETIVVTEIKDIPADEVHKVRKELRAINSEVVCGKSTVMMKAIEDYLEKAKKNNNLPKHHNADNLQRLSDALERTQLCIIFTNEDISKVNEITSKVLIEKEAKVGNLSPIEVVLKAGPTGMDASQIDYFQALKIQTKVNKKQLEIVNDTRILVIGQKITLSEINLMKKFDIKPYRHFVEIKNIYLKGKLYDSGILKINDKYIQERVEQGLKNVAAFGMAAHIPNRASAPHMLANAFKNLVGLGLSTGVQFSQAAAFFNAPKASAVTEPKETKQDTKKAKEPEPEPEEEDAGGFGDLFG